MMRVLLFILIIVPLLNLVGCVGSQTFSNVARTGDTVMVSLAQATGAEYLDAQDITAEVIDSAANAHAVTIRELVRLYADPISFISRSPAFPQQYQGQWVALVDLADASGTPPNLAPGAATLQLTHQDSAIDLYDPTLTILAGTGSAHPMENTSGYMSASLLRPMAHVGVKTEGSSSTIVAGATYVIHVNTGSVSPDALIVSKFSQDPYVQLSFAKRDLGNDVHELTIMVLNPNGFFDAINFTDHDAGKSLLRDLAFVLAWSATSTLSLGTDIVMVDSEYIDINGNVIPSGLTASFYGGYGYVQN